MNPGTSLGAKLLITTLYHLSRMPGLSNAYNKEKTGLKMK